MKTIEDYTTAYLENWKAIYPDLSDDMMPSLEEARQKAIVRKIAYDRTFKVIDDLPEESKEELRRLFKAKEELYYLPFGMSTTFRGRSIDDEIKDIVGGYVEGHHMDAVNDALKPGR